MGRLTDDMARLVEEIHAGRDERRRLTRDLKHATAKMRRSVARLQDTVATDIAGARAAWLGRRASVSPRAALPESVAPKGREAKDRSSCAQAAHPPSAGARLPRSLAERTDREEVLGEAAEERSRLEAERPAHPDHDEARVVRKAGRQRRPH